MLKSNNQKMKNKSFLTAIALMGFAAAVQAVPVTFTFLENGANQNLGSSSTFTEGADTLNAYASSGQSLFAKSSGGGEIGLGIASDPSGTHEIYGTTFVQILAPTGESITGFLIENNIPALDNANIFVSTTLGVLGTKLAGPLGGAYSVPVAYQSGYYIGIQSWLATGGADTWIGSVVVTNTSSVPDGGTTVMLLGSALVGLGLIKRKLSA
jgi:hypothetical protein